MLSQEDFTQWCRRLDLQEKARNLIQQIRSSPPNRRVSSIKKNVSGRYPSRKMGLTIQFESHKNELAAILEFEYDPDILEYFDQPFPPLKLQYKAKNGKQLCVLHTPDFFLIRKNSAGWVECKTEKDLLLLAEKQPTRYFRDNSGYWFCPPGETYAKQFELLYQLRSSAQSNPLYLRNIEFLEDYLRDTIQVPQQYRELIFSIIKSEPGITLGRLLGLGLNINADQIYALIAARDIFVDLTSAPLAERERITLFTEKPPDSVISHNSDPYTLKRLSPLSEQTHSTPNKDILMAASPDGLAKANYRYAIVSAYLRGEDFDPQQVKRRTLFRWIAQYRQAQQLYGDGYLGLIPNHNSSGNRTDKITTTAKNLMAQFIENEYETIKQKPMVEVYGALTQKCEALGIKPPSYVTFTFAIKNREPHQQILKRRGPRAAYQHTEFYYELDIGTPRHGDRPFHICHLDHTELDIELVCSTTGQNLGRPWLTLMSDAFSRRILALYLTYDPPSYRSCMMVLRDSVRRHHRLPQILVVDGGKEFESVYFESLLAKYECTKKTRPAASPRFGSVIERLFGTANTRFIYNLAGNTQITKRVRQVTKSVNPKLLAIWTLGTIYDRLVEWAYEIYDTLPHPALGQTPRDSFTAGLEQSGYRNHRQINYDDEFLILTLPTTPKGTAQVWPGRGVKINNIYYWSNAFRDPAIEKSAVPVRYDPFDVSTAYAYVGKRWVTCQSEYYSAFHGHSQRELMLLTSELRKRYKNHSREFKVTAKRLAEFLTSVEEEELILSQRLRDQEAKAIFRTMSSSPLNTVTNIDQKPGKETNTNKKQAQIKEKTINIDELEEYEEF